MPLPASVTLTSRARPPPTGAAVIGSRIGPSAEARACSAAIAFLTAGPERSVPVTTTCAGEGVCGKACWIRSKVATIGTVFGTSSAG